MKRIIIHWTAGTYTPNSTDLIHYHFLIDGNGKVIKGKFKPENNEKCIEGKYAAHCGGGNTGSIGVALCGMYNYKSPSDKGLYPIKENQLITLFDLCRILSMKYGIKNENIITHYEFGIANPSTSSRGKIDINFLPPFPDISPQNVGNYLRKNILKNY